MKRNVHYLRSLSDFPIAVLVDHDGIEWTFAEGRSIALAIRGVLPGVSDKATRWRNPAGWRPTAKLVMRQPRKWSSRVYDRDTLLSWSGDPWVPPADPCPHCGGTGERHGTRTGRMRTAAFRERIVFDRNLFAQLLVAFEPGAIIVDASNRRQDGRDPVRLKSTTNETRAVLARSLGEPEPDYPTIDEMRSELDGPLALGSPVHVPEEEPEPEGPSPGSTTLFEPSADPVPLEWSKAFVNEDAAVYQGPRPSARRRDHGRVGNRESECPQCGGTFAGGVCGSCGYAQ